MPLSREQKQEIVKNLADKLKNSKSVVFSDFHGLTVSDSEDLRISLREQKIEYQVIKKNLLKIALEKASLKVGIDDISGCVSVALSPKDEVAIPRILKQFSDQHEQLKMLKGILDNREVDLSMLEKLAVLPSKEELLGKTIGALKGNLYGLVNVLQGNIRGLVYVLQEHIKNINN